MSNAVAKAVPEPKPKRLQFSLRWIFAVVTIACFLLVGWTWLTTTRFWVDLDVPATVPTNQTYGGRASMLHGRFFCLNGPATVSFNLNPKWSEEPNRVWIYGRMTDRIWPGIYRFSAELPPIKGRCDIWITTSTGIAEVASFGDLSIPKNTKFP
jgi:hypothetical protein